MARRSYGGGLLSSPLRLGTHDKDTQARQADDARRLLCELGDHIRAVVTSARNSAQNIDMAAIEGATAADTIYAIDRVADDVLIDWFDEHWPNVEVVSEGLDVPVVVGSDPEWTVIVDTIDGTRGFMYDKRAAWCLAAAAPHGGSLRDIVAAAMTELPTVKQGAADQLSSVRGTGVRAERVALTDESRTPLTVRPSSNTDLEHGFAQFAKYLVPGKVPLAELEAELFQRIGASTVFDDQYISSGGQLHELLTGRDRFVADLRPLVTSSPFVCHPYDVCTAMLLEEAGGVVTDPWGRTLDAPLDTTSPVAWAGYANQALADRIGPVLRELADGVDDG
jgi:fructose-1,6-bisphosphatase/inositol monophosphatase family enzyme